MLELPFIIARSRHRPALDKPIGRFSLAFPALWVAILAIAAVLLGYGAMPGTALGQANQPPAFPAMLGDPCAVAITSEEHPADRNLGDPVAATDPDGDFIIYRLEGLDAGLFAIKQVTGQIYIPDMRFLDFERSDSYTFSVVATDPAEAEASCSVAVTVTDVNEPPAAPPALTVSAHSDTELAVRWTRPYNTGPAITGYQVQYRELDASDWEPHAFTFGEDTFVVTTVIGGLSAVAFYEAQVKTVNEDGEGEWSRPGIGMTRGIALSLSAPRVAEDDPDPEPVKVRATLGAALASVATVTVSVGSIGDSATSGTDFEAVADFVITITEGKVNGAMAFTLTPLKPSDDTDEGDETITISGTAGGDATGFTVRSATLTLTDDGSERQPFLDFGLDSAIPENVFTGSSLSAADVLEHLIGADVAIEDITLVTDVPGLTVRSVRAGCKVEGCGAENPKGKLSLILEYDDTDFDDMNRTIDIIVDGSVVYLPPANNASLAGYGLTLKRPIHIAAVAEKLVARQGGATTDNVTVEEGKTATYQLCLANRPGDYDFAVAVENGNSSVATLSHERASFSTVSGGCVMIEVTGRNLGAQLSGSATILHTPDDPRFESAIVTVNVTAAPGDGVGIGPVKLEVSEQDGQATYEVALRTEPASEVTVAAASDSAAATVSPSTLTFDASNWSDSQEVTVTGVADSADVDRVATITHTVTSDDANYDALPADSVEVTVLNVTDSPPR